MDKVKMCAPLPETPPKGMLRWVEASSGDDITDEYTVFRSVRVRLTPPMEDIMDNVTVGKSVWAADCICTACGEWYTTRKVPGVDAIEMICGDDGCSYTADPGGDVAMDLWPVAYDGDTARAQYMAGETVCCPMCGSNTTLIPAKRIGNGRLKQLQVATLQRVGDYAVIVYWLARKSIREYGSLMDAAPRYAYVLDEGGRVHAFTHRNPGFAGNDTPGNGWRPLSSNKDRWDTRYHDWGSINNAKVGTMVCTVDLPDLTGTAAEKTGLLDYWRLRGERPLAYLNLWRKHPQVENLVVNGFGRLVEYAIEALNIGYDPVVELQKAVDLTKTKPSEMLGISKEDFRQLRAQRFKPDLETMVLWRSYKAMGGDLGMLEFMEQIAAFTLGGMRAALVMMDRYGDRDLLKLRRYMEKQQLPTSLVQRLLDTRNMFQAANPGQPMTTEMLWPRHLMAVHDRLAQTARNGSEHDHQEGFDAVLAKFGSVQWTDGELAVVLPRCNGDLIREGQVLQHCVGGYGTTHAKGISIILFIRRYRRQERSYYTLNVNFSGPVPEEIQLHGYGNERHGDRKQYRHTIPKKVRAFVDRWKQDILLPWWQEQNRRRAGA